MRCERERVARACKQVSTVFHNHRVTQRLWPVVDGVFVYVHVLMERTVGWAVHAGAAVLLNTDAVTWEAHGVLTQKSQRNITSGDFHGVLQ